MDDHQAPGTDPATSRTTVQALFDAIDRGDVDALVAMFSTDVAQRIGNSDWTYGQPALRAGNETFLSRIGGLQHEITGLWESAGTVLVRSEVTYQLMDGRQVVIPAMTAYTVDDGGLIATYQVWSDTSPLRAPAAAG